MKFENKSFVQEPYEAPAILDITAVSTPVLYGETQPSGGEEPSDDDLD